MFSAFEMVRRNYECMYTDTCIVTEYTKVLNADKSTSLKEQVTCENQPCRLSVSSKTQSEDITAATKQAQTITLFISPDINIKAGSLITVTHNGRTAEFKNSGFPAVYPTHQEIVLELKKEWA